MYVCNPTIGECTNQNSSRVVHFLRELVYFMSFGMPPLATSDSFTNDTLS